MSFTAFGTENIGDVLENIYSTDILTYINDTVVPSYSINGKILFGEVSGTSHGEYKYYKMTFI